VTTVALPDDIVTSITGPYFLDSVPLPASSSYASALLLCNRTYNGTTFGVVAWDADWQRILTASQLMNGYTAACGIGGGMMGLATTYNGIPLIEIHDTPLVADNWNLAGTILFDGVQGTIQAMAQKGELLYGFIRGTPKNAFFSVKPTDGATPVAVYYDAAEAALAYLPDEVGARLGTPRPTAFCGQHMYAIGESQANVLYTSLYNTTTSLPLPQSNAWSLFIDEPRNRAFTLCETNHGYLVPCEIKPDGTLDRTGQGTLELGSWRAPALDTNLQLIYVASLDGLKVYDAVTVQDITPSDLDPSVGGVILPGGTWADSENGLLLVVGVSDKRSQLGIYRVTVDAQ
jgi:hypothetical protein